MSPSDSFNSLVTPQNLFVICCLHIWAPCACNIHRRICPYPFLSGFRGYCSLLRTTTTGQLTYPACPKVYTLLPQRRLVSGLTNSKTLKNEKKKMAWMKLKIFCQGTVPLAYFMTAKLSVMDTCLCRWMVYVTFVIISDQGDTKFALIKERHIQRSSWTGRTGSRLDGGFKIILVLAIGYC